MAIEFECPECETTIRVKDSAAGKTGRCPQCRVLLMVPDPDDWEDEEGESESGAEQESGSDRPAVPAQSTPAPEPEPEPEPPVTVPPVVDSPVIDTGAPQAEHEPFPPTVKPGEFTPAESKDEPDTIISASPPVLADNQETTRPGPSPTEIHAGDVPVFAAEAAFPVASTFSTTDPRVAAALRRRSRKNRGGLPTKTLVTLASAVGGILLVLGVGWWLYAGSGPELTGPLDGERLSRVRLAEVSAPIPTEEVSDEVVDRVMGSLGGEGFPLRSEYITVGIYAGADRIDIAIEPGPRAVAVRVPLADNADVRAALKSVEKSIARAKREELKNATADMFEDYADFIEDGAPIKRLLEYRDQVALNAAVGTVGYAVEAIVGVTPFPCVYEDSEGYCYFFVPEGTDSFRLQGRKVLGDSEDAPLPVDFEVTLIDIEEPVDASQTATEEDVKPEQEESGEENDETDNESGAEAEPTAETDAEDEESDGEMRKTPE